MRKVGNNAKVARVDDRKRISLAGFPASGDYHVTFDPHSGEFHLVPVDMAMVARAAPVPMLTGSGARPR